MNGAATLRVATYNVHGGVGADGRHDPERVAAVVGELAADVVALQEVTADRHGDLFGHLARSFDGHAVAGVTLDNARGRFGNLLLSRWPVADYQVVDLAYHRREPRNAILAVVAGPAGPLRVIATHFGLNRHERASQAGLVADLVRQQEAAGPLVIAGDFNDWPPLSRAGALIRRSLGLGLLGVRRLRTFPARFPILALDRILVRPGAALRGSRAHRSALSRRASDHLPVVAEVRVGAAKDRRA